jgi:hypothetical protein
LLVKNPLSKSCRCNRNEKPDVAMLKIRSKSKREQEKRRKRGLRRFENRKKTSE